MLCVLGHEVIEIQNGTFVNSFMLYSRSAIHFALAHKASLVFAFFF